MAQRGRSTLKQGFARHQAGLSIIELAVVIGLLMLLLVAGTDYSLAILARQETYGAARAGMEYSINQGYSSTGIEAAVRNSRGSYGSGLRYARIESVTATAQCACYADFSVATACTATCLGVNPTDVSIPSSLYAKVTVRGSYTPLVPLYWPGLQSGKVWFTATYVGKSYYP